LPGPLRPPARPPLWSLLGVFPVQFLGHFFDWVMLLFHFRNPAHFPMDLLNHKTLIGDWLKYKEISL
jgi:hypothetical protein